MRLALPASALAIATVLVLAAPARAGTYEHVSLPPGTDGWSPAAGGGFVSVADSVAAGTGLRVGFWYRNPFDPGDGGEWGYAAPPGTEIVAWRAQREVMGVLRGDWQAVIWAGSGAREQPFAALVPASDRPWSDVALTGLHADRISVRMVCGGPGQCWHTGDSAQLGVRDAIAVLRDDVAPQVGVAHGDLADERTLAGTARLSVPATDAGGGLLRAAVLVDGVERSSSPVDGGSACHDLDPGPGRRFAARVPCPLGATLDAALDTRGLSDGLHEVRVIVEDAAGNRTTVLGPSTRTIDNHPAPPPAGGPGGPDVAGGPGGPGGPGGAGGAGGAGGPNSLPASGLRVRAWLPAPGRRARSVTVRHGAAVRILGTVSDPAGRPVGGELLTLMARVGARRATPAALARTRADGHFTAWLGAGPTRRVLVTTASGARSPRLTVSVRAAATLALQCRGRWIGVRGTLRGGWVPRPGALVTIQARSHHGWVALTTLRTDPGGRFHGRIAAGQGDRIRAAVPRQPGYPFAAGFSPSRALRTAARTSR